MPSQFKLAPMFAAALIYSGGPVSEQTAFAGSSAVGENGTASLSRAGAFVAKADDPTAVVHNPSGIAKLRRPTVFIGSSLIQHNARFQRVGNYQVDPLDSTSEAYTGVAFPEITSEGSPSAIPMVMASFPITDKLVIGGGIFAPHLATPGDYPTTVTVADGVEAPSPQRYDYVDISGIVVLPTLSVGYAISDNLRVGARVSVAYADISAVIVAQALANEAEQASYDTLVNLDLLDRATPAFGLGVQYDLRDFEFAAAYNSQVVLGLKGTASVELDTLLGSVVQIDPVEDDRARCAPGGSRRALRACVSYTIPQTAAIGARWVAKDAAGDELADIEFDIRWENWKAADSLSATIDGRDTLLGTELGTTTSRSGFRDVFAFRLGGEKRFSFKSSQLKVRGGIGYDTAAAPNSWTRIGVDGTPHLTLATGAGFEVGHWKFDLGFSFVATPRRFVEDQIVLPGTPLEARRQPDIPAASLEGENPANPYNAGSYSRNYLLGSAAVSFTF